MPDRCGAGQVPGPDDAQEQEGHAHVWRVTRADGAFAALKIFLPGRGGNERRGNKPQHGKGRPKGKGGKPRPGGDRGKLDPLVGLAWSARALASAW